MENDPDLAKRNGFVVSHMPEPGNTLIVVTHDRDIMHTVDAVFELRGGIIASVMSHCHKVTPG